MDYSIGEFAKRTGLGIHTLRYYEKEQLIVPARDPGNRRRYSEKDIAWIDFIKRLKATGMPIKEVKRYAALRAAGDTTLCARMELLMQHQEVLEEQIRKLQEHKKCLEEKIAFYQQEIAKYSQDYKP